MAMFFPIMIFAISGFEHCVANYKINLKPEICFLRAIPANALVCTSVILGQQARTMPGKLVSHVFIS